MDTREPPCCYITGRLDTCCPCLAEHPCGDSCCEPKEPAIGALLLAIEAMDMKMTRMGSGEWVEAYMVPAGPWHRILGIARSGNFS